MKFVLKIFESVKPNFEEGGKLKTFLPLYEALENFCFAPSTTTQMAPFARDSRPEDAPLLHHWGIYAFRRDFLNAFVKEERSPLVRCESLEQLRALEMGAKIYVLKAEEAAVGVDHPEDIAKVETLIREMGLA